MGLIAFIKEILLDGTLVPGLAHNMEQTCPPTLREKINRKTMEANVKRIVPISVLMILLELLNQGAILLTRTYPELQTAYLLAGMILLVLTVCAVLLAYRTLNASVPNTRRLRLFYRAFWAALTAVMLVFSDLEIRSQGISGHYFYLLILTAAFPLLSQGEALCLFGVDAAFIMSAALYHGCSPQNLLQLPLVTFFAFILSRMLHHSYCGHAITVEQLERSNQKLAELAQTDPLTGLLNRRGIQNQLEERLKRWERTTDVAFLMIDIDLFQQYNDSFGHDEGDLCLQKVAGAIRRCVRRDTDLAARIGGERFLAVLIGCEATAVLHTAQRLRREILQLGLLAASDKVHRCVTVSIGIAATRTPIDFNELCDQADHALYAAKEAGRNRVVQDGTAYSNDDTEEELA